MHVGIELLAAVRELRKLHAAYTIAQRGLRRANHGAAEILHFDARFCGVPYRPKQNRINVNGNKVFRQRLIGIKRGGNDALVHMRYGMLDKGNNCADARADGAIVAAQTQNYHFLPLRSDAHRAYGQGGSNQCREYELLNEEAGTGPCVHYLK